MPPATKTISRCRGSFAALVFVPAVHRGRALRREVGAAVGADELTPPERRELLPAPAAGPVGGSI